MNFLVSIISEQTLPNYLFIKEFQLQKNIDKYIFITTKQMEKKGKTSAITNTAQIPNDKIIKIFFEEDALFNNIKILEKYLKNIFSDSNFYINLTGGTKLMSITLWEFFSKSEKFKNTFFYYIPINKNIYKKILKNENKTAEKINFKYKITVREYLKIYDIECDAEDLNSTNEKAEKNIKLFLNGSSIIPIEKLSKLFEEYLYFQIKKILNLEDDFIKIRLKLRGKKLNTKFFSNDNEIDIFFIYNNNPFMIEAKSSIRKNKINNYLFKLAAINKRFGLNSKATIMTLSDFSTLSELARKNLKYKTNLLKVYFPFDFNDIKNIDTFKQKLFDFIGKNKN